MTAYNMPPGAHPSQDDARYFPEKDWERATDDAAKLLLSDEAEFEKHVLAETGLDIPTADAKLLLRGELEGIPMMVLTDISMGQTLAKHYHAAVDRLARRQLEGGR